jgi:hypothetical protein
MSIDPHETTPCSSNTSFEHKDDDKFTNLFMIQIVAQPIKPIAMQYLVTKQLLALHDKYDGDLGLLDERWADKRDRELFSAEQMRTLGEYLQQLALSGVDCLAPEFRKEVELKINELELLIDPDVVSTLRDREAHATPKR